MMLLCLVPLYAAAQSFEELIDRYGPNKEVVTVTMSESVLQRMARRDDNDLLRKLTELKIISVSAEDGDSLRTDFLEDAPWLLRPANYTGRAPGRGCGIYDLGRVRIRVLNLIGRCDLAWGADNPFTAADRLLEEGEADFTLVDFHAEATSEKLAMGYNLDGRVSALWGTHTHVPTADERVCPKGTGYITDLGMTGVIESVLGIDPRQSVEGFLGGLPGRYRAPEGPAKLQGAIFTLDSATGLCTAVERIDIR